MKRRNYKIFTTIMLAFSIIVGTIGASLHVYAAEPDNDTLEGADEIKVGERRSGIFDSDGDVDWFKIVLDTDGKMLIDIYAHNQESDKADDDVSRQIGTFTLIDSSGNEIAKTNFRNSQVNQEIWSSKDSSIYFSLRRGTYYFKLVGKKSGDKYNVHTSFTPSDNSGNSGDNPSGNNDTNTTGTGDSIPMYRLYNPNSGEHFYTSSAAEKESLVAATWKYEGIGWYAPSTSALPVYRLYNGGGDHHYTMSEGEKNMLVQAGWSYEGIGWYSASDAGIPLYRQYNPNATAGSHNYTTSKGENDSLVQNGWNAEGIGWYALKEGEPVVESKEHAYYGDYISTVQNLNNGTYRVTFNELEEIIPKTISLDSYNSLGIGCTYPFDPNFHCVEYINGGYLFVHNMYSSWNQMMSDDNYEERYGYYINSKNLYNGGIYAVGGYINEDEGMDIGDLLYTYSDWDGVYLFADYNSVSMKNYSIIVPSSLSLTYYDNKGGNYGYHTESFGTVVEGGKLPIGEKNRLGSWRVYIDESGNLNLKYAQLAG